MIYPTHTFPPSYPMTAEDIHAAAVSCHGCGEKLCSQTEMEEDCCERCLWEIVEYEQQQYLLAQAEAAQDAGHEYLMRERSLPIPFLK